ncbi:RxLR-like protein [Plasmopara halstedii]|uniref:RxLR-like protein n=1 Tax=Plasmopara halstedii TaxID=4781 RepID=A0A0P1AML1_PLAHL|nr:RxLR-like protein [Plasmopara halstedii]CEG42664.1 RxLR-like protein [Plasmopara halstedii]|eukprot:XP_024579033.1 RxLR-like protein [Plasmopara halstedii]
MKVYQCLLAAALVLLRVESVSLRTRDLSAEERWNFEDIINSVKTFLEMHPENDHKLLTRLREEKDDFYNMMKIVLEQKIWMTNPEKNMMLRRWEQLSVKERQEFIDDLLRYDKKMLELSYHVELSDLRSNRIRWKMDIEDPMRLEDREDVEKELVGLETRFNKDETRLKAILKYRIENLKFKHQLDDLREKLKKAAEGQDLHKLTLQEAFKTLDFDAHIFTGLNDEKERVNAIFSSLKYRALFEHAELLYSTIQGSRSSSSGEGVFAPSLYAMIDMTCTLRDVFNFGFGVKDWRQSEYSYVVLATLIDSQIKRLI